MVYEPFIYTTIHTLIHVHQIRILIISIYKIIANPMIKSNITNSTTGLQTPIKQQLNNANLESNINNTYQNQITANGTSASRKY